MNALAVTILLGLASGALGPSHPTEHYEPGAAFELVGGLMLATHFADRVTTERGLARGLRETNPLFRNDAARAILPTAAVATSLLVTEHLHRKGRRRLALWMRIGMAGAFGFAAGRNLYLIETRTR